MGEVWAVIPARGGSKGIPRKNLVDLGGRPLIAYSIELARRVPRVHRVLVSTDDPEIADVARAFGAEVPVLRPARLAHDRAPVSSAVDWLVDRLAAAGAPDVVVQLYPTHPFRSSSALERALDEIERVAQVTSALPVDVDWTRLGYEGEPLVKIPGPARIYQPVGSFVVSAYVPPAWRSRPDARAEYLRNLRGGTENDGALALLSEPGAAIDIDEPSDLEAARVFIEGGAPPPLRRVPLSACVLGVVPIADALVKFRRRFEPPPDAVGSPPPEARWGAATRFARDGNTLDGPNLLDLSRGPLFGAERVALRDGSVHASWREGAHGVAFSWGRDPAPGECPRAWRFALPPLWRFDPRPEAPERRINLRTGAPIVGRQQEPYWIDVPAASRP